MTDFASERRHFPILEERRYFAQQCLGAYPRAMEDDLASYVRTLRRRSVGIPEWTERWEEMHRLVEVLLEAPAKSVFLRDSATAAQGAIAAGLDPVGSRNRVLIGTGDFHSSRYLWRAQADRGFEIVEVETSGDAAIDGEEIASMIDERVRVVALALVSPRTGALLDTAPVVRAARRAGALVVLDVYQAVGIVPIRVRELGAHAIVGGFHKWIGGGGTGLAFGYVEPALSRELRPAYPGWIAHREVLSFADRFEPQDGAEKLQQGMPAMEPVYTSRAGMKWVIDCGIDAIRARSLALTERLLAAAAERGLRTLTPGAAERRGGMVCLNFDSPRTLVTELADEGIDIDTRPGAGIRIGPHPCATEDECDQVIVRIAERAA